MTLAEVCDLSYVLILDQLERQMLADRQALIASGVRDDLPNLPQVQESLDARLHAEPEPMAPVDYERLELLQALGVA